MGKLFEKAKEQALLYLENDKLRIKKHYAKHPGYESNEASSLRAVDKDIAKINALVDFPVNSAQLEGVDVAAKAKIVKQHLLQEFPKIKVSVKIERYSMGCNFNAILSPNSVDILLPEEVKKAEAIVKIYEHVYGSDLQSDYHNNDNYAFLVFEKYIGPGVKGLAFAANPGVISL